MKITKNGFYKISEIYSEKIIVEEGLTVAFFDDLNSSLDLEIGKNSRVEFFGLLEKGDNFKLKTIQKEENSILKINYLVLSKDENKVKAEINSVLSGNLVKSDVKIISIVGEKGFVDLDGIINIEKGIEKVSGHLLEENLFLGDSGKIKAIPTLLVGSSDVQASHACKMERISDEKLFYLRSRGVGKENALSMMIEAKITDLFSSLNKIDGKFYEETLENILNKI